MILVTGGTGMIGQAIISTLNKSRMPLKVQVRSHNSLKNLVEADLLAHPQIETVVCDFENMTVSDACNLCQGVDTIIHTAAYVHKKISSESEYELINVQATKFLAEAGKSENIKQFIFFSTSAVYGNKETSLIDENSKTEQDTAYGTSKLKSEKILYDLKPAESIVCLRPSLVYGPGDRGNMLSLIRQVLSGKYFLIDDGNAQKSLINVKDLARAVEMVVNHKISGYKIYNLSNPEPVSMKELSCQIRQAADMNDNFISLPKNFVTNITKLTQLLLGDKSVLSQVLNQDRLDKLTRTNTISSKRFHNDYAFEPIVSLVDGLVEEISWAKKQNILRSR